ncbi:MAG: hypothetical protein FWG50_02470 [Kiritimatiellaeota bacterium]|nr:hypothetical protein [Kiritimatiellota bacterium]
MKDTLKMIAEALVLILLLPQIFVFLYFFWSVVKIGAGGFGMMKEIAFLGLTISRMAGPFLYLLFLLVRRMNRKRGRALATFAVCWAAGYGGVVAWNLVIFPESFSYFWSILPVTLCSGGAATAVALRGKQIFLPANRGDLFLAGD